MNARTETPEIRFELADPLDMVAIERRARELRAQAFADGMRALARMIARRVAALRPVGGSRPA